jgi:hypothetical protein
MKKRGQKNPDRIGKSVRTKKLKRYSPTASSTHNALIMRFSNLRGDIEAALLPLSSGDIIMDWVFKPQW